MILRTHINWKNTFKLSWRNLLYSFIISAFAYFRYKIFGNNDNWAIPLALVGTLGTALAILLGFRNSAAYDRWWEARKIWGGIVNDSRSWGRQVISLVSLHFHEGTVTKEDLCKTQKTLIYRHLAWINALRLQLRQQTEETLWEKSVRPFVKEEEYHWLQNKRNKATQLVKKQATELQSLFEEGLVENFRHMQMDFTLTRFYDLQGKAERIKFTPLITQYHTWTRLFLNIFIFFLPFGLITIFDEADSSWMVFPVTMIIGWIFFIIYMFGEILEGPFENIATDTPMTALCNTIEIDLKDMLEETGLPEKLQPVDDILM